MTASESGDLNRSATDVGEWMIAGERVRGLGRPDLAARAFRTASELSPHNPDVWLALGGVLAEAGQFAEAEQAYRQVADLLPDRLDARINVGAMLERQHRFVAAAAEYTIAARGMHNLPAALSNLAGVLALQGRPEEALAIYRRAVRRTDPSSGAWSNYLYAQHYCADLAATRIAADHLVWGAKFASNIETIVSPKSRDKTKAHLRIAYLSPNLVRHSVAHFALPVLKGHDRGRVEVWCYSTALRTDAMSQRLRDAADVWVDASRLDDATLAAQIARDEIDVLIDLAGHTADGRLGVMARRPAPLQASYIGYPNTMGLSAVDLRFSDGVADPNEIDGRLISERLVRLPRPFLAYAPPDEAPVIGRSPSGSGRIVTFGSLNNLAKVSPQCLDMWAETMRAVPDSRILLKARSFSDVEARDRITALFEARGVKANRLDLRPHLNNLQEHLETYQEIDIALDSAPYNGTTTTMEALWMGVPVISMQGDRHSSRVGRSLLSAIGLGQFVQNDKRSYVKAAVDLADDVDSRVSLRQRLRGKIASSPLADGQGMAQALEGVIFSAWAR
ncbi:MAG: O-linked N-acetylglucosamine transferase, SPINDLY family protein [Alphaproteobacteria bacterium]